jgi:hypothetical protein
MAQINRWAAIGILCAASFALAENPDDLAYRQEQVERARAEVANQVQLLAYDLLDELVFQWLSQPPFNETTPVVLADVTIPVGFGSGFEALVENHFMGVVAKNPNSKVLMTHCPQCTAMMVHSGAKGTIISRGYDQPEALALAGKSSGARHALFLDFEVEGTSLVLRARMTSLEPALPIVYARTLSMHTSTPAMLRAPEALKSAADARKEYLDILRGRDFLLFPVRVGVRSYAAGTVNNTGGLSLGPIPFIWIQGGVETAFSQARAWTGGLTVGISYLPAVQTSLMAQGRISRLVSGSVTSLTHPDFYVFGGMSVYFMTGVGVLPFLSQTPDIANSLATLVGSTQSTSFAAFQTGMEVRLKNRLGLGVFLESAPTLGSATGVGNYLDFGFIRFQTIGAEVSLCF